MSDKLNVRPECLYTKDHEWAKPGEGGVTVGITAYAVDQLGDITLVNIDVKGGDSVSAGNPFGTIESVKTLSDLFVPVSGKVLRVNRELETNTAIVGLWARFGVVNKRRTRIFRKDLKPSPARA